MYQNDPAKVLTGEVRLVNARLTEPYVMHHDDKTRYSVTLLVSKTDADTMSDIGASMLAAVLNAGSIACGIHFPIQDGDGDKPDGSPYGTEYRGHWVIQAAAWTKPQIVHRNDHTSELPPQEIYSGMYGRATLHFYGYDLDGITGVGCVLGNILKTREGERVYTTEQLARAGARLALDAIKENRGDVLDSLLTHLHNFSAENVHHILPAQYGAFAAGLRNLGACV